MVVAIGRRVHSSGAERYQPFDFRRLVLFVACVQLQARRRCRRWLRPNINIDWLLSYSL